MQIHNGRHFTQPIAYNFTHISTFWKSLQLPNLRSGRFMTKFPSLQPGFCCLGSVWQARSKFNPKIRKLTETYTSCRHTPWLSSELNLPSSSATRLAWEATALPRMVPKYLAKLDVWLSYNNDIMRTLPHDSRIFCLPFKTRSSSDSLARYTIKKIKSVLPSAKQAGQGAMR